MYGSMDGKSEAVPLVSEKEEHEMVRPRANRTFFEGPFESDFWNKVRDFYHDGQLHWSDALNQAHYSRLLNEAEEYGKDPAVYMMVDCVNEFWDLKKPKKYLEEIYPSFEKEVSRMLKIVLEKGDEACRAAAEDADDVTLKYAEKLPADETGIKKTLLHIAAEQNLREVAKMLLDRYQGLQYVHTRGGGESKKLPLEYALSTKDDKDRDAVAALLVQSMLNEKIRELFQYDYVGEKPAKFSFVHLASRPNMKKTVVAVLGAMINPDWPFILMEDENSLIREKAWQTDPNLPIRYHFFYQLLDQDEEGQPPLKKQEDDCTVLVSNPNFNHRSKSGLAALSQGPHRKFAVHHPVIRVLAQRKWNIFGQRTVMMHTLMYCLFLVFLSIAFLTAAHADDPLVYKKPIDFVRLICEICGLLFGFVYLLDELDQMEKEGLRYWNIWENFFNYLDLVGLGLLFACVPLRILKDSSQWITAAITFMINVLRIFKYSFAWEDVGLYAKTLAKMIIKDMKIFGAVYVVVLCAFSGGVFLSLKATGGLGKVNGFTDIILRGVRAVAEGKEFADDYNGFNVFVLILILLNMLVIIVFLMNILIAQLSYRYDQAMAAAKVQYDVDKIGLVARIENSRFRRFNLRAKHYIDGDYVNDINKIANLISVWKETLVLNGLDDKESLLQDAKEGWTKKQAADHYP